MERSLGADLADKVDLFGIDECLVLILIVFFSDGDSGKTGTLFPQIGDNSSGVHASDCWDTFSCTPFTQAFHRRPVGIFFCHVRNHHSHSLDIGTLKIFQQAMLVSHA